MKKPFYYLMSLSTFLVLFLIVGCGGSAKKISKTDSSSNSKTTTNYESSTLAKYETPALRLNFLTDKSGKYRYTPPIDGSLAGQVTELDYESAESVLCYFLAAQIRGDKAWEKTVPAVSKRGTELRIGLKMYEGMVLEKAKLLKKEAVEPDEIWVTVALWSRMDGTLEESEGEFVLQQIGGQWLLVEVTN